MTDDTVASPAEHGGHPGSEFEGAITVADVPDHRRMTFLPRYFNPGMMQFEQAVYNLMGHMCEDYTGGMWKFRTLSNGGAYMAPSTDRKFKMQSENGWSGELSADAAGIAVCMFALSHLSFDERFSDTFAERFHQLRDYAFGDHPEAAAIIAMCD